VNWSLARTRVWPPEIKKVYKNGNQNKTVFIFSAIKFDEALVYAIWTQDEITRLSIVPAPKPLFVKLPNSKDNLEMVQEAKNSEGPKWDETTQMLEDAKMRGFENLAYRTLQRF
jgi:hypothetical protein